MSCVLIYCRNSLTTFCCSLLEACYFAPAAAALKCCLYCCTLLDSSLPVDSLLNEGFLPTSAAVGLPGLGLRLNDDCWDCWWYTLGCFPIRFGWWVTDELVFLLACGC